MNNDLAENITLRLQGEFKLKKRGQYLQGGRCPHCGDKSLWTWSDKPFYVSCNHLNNCGFSFLAKDYYPDLFESWTDRFQVPQNQLPHEQRNPHAAADAYLSQDRGFDLERIKGWYTQETYATHEGSSATIRFAVGNTWWERIIDKPQRFGKKANFQAGGSFAGHWWCPPSYNFKENMPKEIWLVEGIFDAIALMHHGIVAVSLMSCGNYPEHSLNELKQLAEEAKVKLPTLVWALDSNQAGKQSILRHEKKAEGWKNECALISQEFDNNKDWSDCHITGQLEEINFLSYRYNGRIHLAKRPKTKAKLMYERTKQLSFGFDFNNRIYWAKVNPNKLDSDDKDDLLTISEICGCLPKILYRQVPFNDIDRLKSPFYVSIDYPHAKKQEKLSFSNATFGKNSEFNNAMMSLGAIFTGSSSQLMHYYKNQIEMAKNVYTLNFTGYAKEYNAYLFKDLAITNGKLYFTNSEDYFVLNKKAIKTSDKSSTFRFPSANVLKNEPPEFFWFQTIYDAYGVKGYIALAYWFASYFAEQIRSETKSFPFLEVVGEAGSGKTTLINFLWKLSGRVDYEGFDPNKATDSALARNLLKVSNLPVVLIEADRENKSNKIYSKGWSWDYLKDLYNGNCPRILGEKNYNFDTYEPPFRGSIVIAQNNLVEASQPVIERILGLWFDTKNHSEKTWEAGKLLERLEAEDLSWFMIQSLLSEKQVLEIITQENIRREMDVINEKVKIRYQRIVENHAKLRLFVKALFSVFNLPKHIQEECLEYICNMGNQQQNRLSDDHPIVEDFWRTYDFINQRLELRNNLTIEPLNHSLNRDELIAVNLNEFVEIATELRQQVPLLSVLRQHLKDSKSVKYKQTKAVKSRILKNEKTIHCWVFERPKTKK